MSGISEGEGEGSAVRSLTAGRRPRRLSGYNYGEKGTYFLTFCVEGLDCVLCKPSGELLPYGEVTNHAIRNIDKVYIGRALVKDYIIMPNHVHLMLVMTGAKSEGSAVRSLTVSTVVGQLKGYITKQLGRRIWEESFYDHIMRDREDYEAYVEYIAYELLTWERDRYYRA